MLAALPALAKAEGRQETNFVNDDDEHGGVKATEFQEPFSNPLPSSFSPSSLSPLHSLKLRIPFECLWLGNYLPVLSFKVANEQIERD